MTRIHVGFIAPPTKQLCNVHYTFGRTSAITMIVRTCVCAEINVPYQLHEINEPYHTDIYLWGGMGIVEFLFIQLILSVL